jgi:outer membrane murein-binding lipoprotein Lpp
VGDAARKEPLEDKMERLLTQVQRLANDVERLLNRQDHLSRRAANLTGPTTPEAEARVERRLAKLRGK